MQASPATTLEGENPLKSKHRITANRLCKTGVSFLLMLSMLASSGILLPPLSSAISVNQADFPTYLDRGFTLHSPIDRVTHQLLLSLTGGNDGVGEFEKAIQQYFLDYGARQVLLDIGWQNYTEGNVPMEQWVSNWLTACDLLGITNDLYVGQLTSSGIGSPWVTGLLQADPTTQTYYSNGTKASYVSLDNPDVVKAIESDLLQIYRYYGDHQSWVGLSTGVASNNPYYIGNSTAPVLGYSNYSIQSFANSNLFRGDLNSSGYDPNGTLDALWASYCNITNSTLLSSGLWMSSSPLSVAGSGADQFRIAMRFHIPSTSNDIQIGWYGNKARNPTVLQTTLYEDVNGTVGGKLLQSVNESSVQVSSAPGWQQPIEYLGNFSGGYYWLVFSTPTSADIGYYDIYLQNYFGQGSPAESAIGPSGSWSLRGSAILWVKDHNGNDLSVYPFKTTSASQPSQSFTAPGTFSFNTVFLFLQQRFGNATNATFSFVDLESNKVMAQAILSQSISRGLENWVPLVLNSTVQVIAGHKYSMQIIQQTNDYSWQSVIRASVADPPEGGFQNQSIFWLFRLALLNTGLSHIDYQQFSITSLGTANGSSLAMSFSPSHNESIVSFAIRMSNPNGQIDNYSTGTLSLSLRSGDRMKPSNSIIRTVTIPGQSIQQNGWLNLTSLNVPLIRDNVYWLVFSSEGGTTFFFARLANPYQSIVLESTDDGKSWNGPSAGPTDFSFRLISTGEVLGDPINGMPKFTISAVSSFAQPFVPASSSQVDGVYLGPVGRQSKLAQSDHIVVSIHPDDGKNEPSGVVIASGNLYGDNMTVSSADFAQFSSIARITGGQRYWIVLEAQSGLYTVSPIEYQASHSAGESVMISNDNGFTWQEMNANKNGTTDTLSYMLDYPEADLPTLNSDGLYNSLSSFHLYDTQTGDLRGWNAYVQLSYLRGVDTITNWFNAQANKSWLFSTTAQVNVLSQSGLTQVNLLPVSTDFVNCDQLYQYLFEQMPIANLKYYPSMNSGLIHSCSAPKISDLASVLSRLPYFGNSLTANVSGSVTTSSVSGASNVSGLQPPVYGVYGQNGGPFLLWLSNPTEQTLTFSVRLNLTNVGLSNEWEMINLNDLSAKPGNSSIINVNATLLSHSWAPLYVSSKGDQLSIFYSNVFLERQLVYPGESLYYLRALPNQPSLIALISYKPVQSILIDDQRNLTQVSSLPQLIDSSEGWYFDNTSSTVVVKYQSLGNNSLRVLQANPPPATVSPFPIQQILILLLSALCVEGIIVLYLKVVGQRRVRSPKTHVFA